MSKDHIKEYWESQGETHGESHWASWGDNWMIDLEIDTIGKHLKDGDRVLDIGCAKGFMLYDMMRLIPGIKVRGIDVSEYAIEHAVPEVKVQYPAIRSGVVHTAPRRAMSRLPAFFWNAISRSSGRNCSILTPRRMTAIVPGCSTR